MRDITSYFGSNTRSESTNTSVSSENVTERTSKKRQIEDDAPSTQRKRKSLEVRRSSRNHSLDSSVSYEAEENNSSENVRNQESNAPKKSIPRRKSSIKKELDVSLIGADDTSTKQKSDSVARKRRKNGSDRSEPDVSDSSEDLFESRVRERPRKTYSKKSVSRETKEENNLFNYFVKAENANIQKDSKLLDSPVDCMKKVQVVVQVHSPPRTRPTRQKKSTKKVLSPVVKLVDTRATASSNLDLIEVIETEDATSSLKTNKVAEERSSLPPMTESKIEEDEDSDSSAIFSNGKRAVKSAKKLILEDSDSESTKNNSFRKSEHAETDSASSDSNSEDPVWRMRVQFAPKTEISCKPKKSKSKGTDEDSCYEGEELEEEEEEEEEIVEEKKSKRKDVKETSRSKKEPKKSEQPSKQQQKLAPLFCKQYKKKVDRTVDVDDEARKLFLSSGLPEVVKKKFDEQKNVPIEEETFTCYKFPAISHVQQKSEHFVWHLPEIDFSLKTVMEEFGVPSCRSFVSFINNKDTKALSGCPQKLDFNLKDEIAALKKLEPTVNVGDVYSSVRRLYNEAESIDSICWTDKYRPSSCDDLMVDKSNLMKLKEWIESHKRLKIVYSDRDSSSEEFVDSDDSSHNSKMENNVAILAGPPGCGKTCAVYTLAKELGFEVLEVNSASNRDGKRLLDELLEATQSHRVKRATIFEKTAKDKKSSQKKKKKKKSNEEKRERKTMSLILIEDADILFENYDEGFLAALGTLARESKRPLVFTVNDLNCPHLNKYRKNLNLQFDYPSRARINVWLKLIALTEGVKLSDAVLIDLFDIAGLDVRKSLLQLQMLISSKLCSSVLDGEKLFYQDWCRRLVQCEKQPTLPGTEPAECRDNDDDVFSPKKDATVVEALEVPKPKSPEPEIGQCDRETNRRLLNDHAKFMDIVTLLGHFESNQDENVYPRAGDSWHEDLLRADIHSSLKREVFANFEDSKSSVSFSEYYKLVRKNAQIKSVYENTVSSYMRNAQIKSFDRYAKYCDFLPMLRSITRLEKSKQSNLQRRTSRFFSYLKSINIYLNDQEMEFLRDSMV